MALLLLAVGAFVYARVGSSLGASLNHGLALRADDVAAALRSGGGDRRDFAGAEGVAQLLERSGRVLQGTPGLGTTPLLTGARLQAARRGPVRFDRAAPSGLGTSRWRVVAQPASAAPDAPIAVVAASLEPRAEALRHLLAQLLFGGAAVLLLASAGAYALAAAALRPVEAMSGKAAAISLRGDDQRLPVPPGGDEIAKLGTRLNEMLARIEAAFAHERRFLADASHELQTPLAILRTELELAARRPRSREELEGVVQSAREEVDRLGRLAEDLLVVARSDQGGLPVSMARVPAEDLVREAAARFRPLASQAGRQITTDVPAGLELTCDPLRIGQALGNLVDNSLRHGAGDVAVSAIARNGVVELHVQDHGAGFSTAFLPRAFDRFSRPDEGRSGQGSGLGLAIVLAIAQAHGGQVGAANRAGGGADVWLSLAREA